MQFMADVQKQTWASGNLAEVVAPSVLLNIANGGG